MDAQAKTGVSSVLLQEPTPALVINLLLGAGPTAPLQPWLSPVSRPRSTRVFDILFSLCPDFHLYLLLFYSTSYKAAGRSGLKRRTQSLHFPHTKLALAPHADPDLARGLSPDSKTRSPACDTPAERRGATTIYAQLMTEGHRLYNKPRGKTCAVLPDATALKQFVLGFCIVK